MSAPSLFWNIFVSITTSCTTREHLESELFAPAAIEKHNRLVANKINIADSKKKDDNLSFLSRSIKNETTGARTTVWTTSAASNPTTFTNTRVEKATILERIQISRQRLKKVSPAWLLEFIDFQKEQLALLTQQNWMSGDFRFLILRCTKEDKSCGGLSDRLKPLPYLIRVAYETKRIFFIRWEDRPYPLEEFLQPTEYFNWTVPDYILPTLEASARVPNNKLQSVLHKKRKLGNQNSSLDSSNRVYGMNLYSEIFLEEAHAATPILLETKKQLGDGGRQFFEELITQGGDYNENKNQTYESLYHGLFRALFHPSPDVGALVQEQLDRMQLIPGEYSVAHSRTFFKATIEEVSRERIAILAKNAVNCSSQLHPGYPIYFASDSAYASKVIQGYAKSLNYPIHTNSIRKSKNQRADPLHLEFASRGNKTWPIDSFYDTFVDILILGNSRCISYGQGGYGKFANLLSFDPECYQQNYDKGKPVPCTFASSQSMTEI